MTPIDQDLLSAVNAGDQERDQQPRKRKGADRDVWKFECMMIVLANRLSKWKSLMKQLISLRSIASIGKTCRKFMTPNVPRMPLHRQIFWLRALTIFTAIAPFHTLEADAQGDEQPLFDGKTFHGWTTLDGKPVTEGGKLWMA